MVIKKVYKEWFNNSQIKHDYHEEIKPDGEIIDYYKEYFSNGQIKKNRFYDSGFYFEQLYFEDGKIKECKEFGTIDTNIEPPQPSYTSLDDGGWIEETKREEDCFWEETRYYKFTYKELKEWTVDGQLLIEYNKDEHTEWYENGQVKIENTTVNGDPGDKEFYQCGQVKCLSLGFGATQKWYENGQLKKSGNKKWHENGQLKSIEEI
jgi:antitoxin component YwqK of YwqJK toxin-antitoxin module